MIVEKDPFINFISDLSEKIRINREHKQIMERGNDSKVRVDEYMASLDNLILSTKEKIESNVTNKESVPILASAQIIPSTSSIEVVSEENNFQDFVGKLKAILAKPKEILKDNVTTPYVSSSLVSSVKSEEQENVKKYVSSLNQPKTKETTNTKNYIEELDKIKNSIQIEKEDKKIIEIKELIEEYAEKYIKKTIGMMGESGGGTVAVQYANGGTMNGNLNVNGDYLSGGVSLLDIFALQPDLDNQTLSFNDTNYDLSISYGNTVNLSAINTTFKASSGKYESSYTTTNSNSANWSSVYTTVNNLSASWEESAEIIPTVTNYLSTNNIVLSSATITNYLSTDTIYSSGTVGVISDNINEAGNGENTLTLAFQNGIFIENNLTIQGNLTALGTSTFQNTIFTTTSALSVVNLGPGPALYVYQASGPYDVASFYDGDGVEVLHVGNAQGGGNPFGKVGINTSDPSAELTVNGAISSNGIITVLGGNSNQWNSNYTTTRTNSANYILDGGNAKGANISIGTNDAYNLTLRTLSTTRVQINSSGEVNFYTNLPGTLSANLSLLGTPFISNLDFNPNAASLVGQYVDISPANSCSTYLDDRRDIGYLVIAGFSINTQEIGGSVGDYWTIPANTWYIAIIAIGEENHQVYLTYTSRESNQTKNLFPRSLFKGLIPNGGSTGYQFSSAGVAYSATPSVVINSIAGCNSYYVPISTNVHLTSKEWAVAYTTTNTNSATWSNWSTVSASYALGSQYVKLSGDTMTGALSTTALSANDIFVQGKTRITSRNVTNIFIGDNTTGNTGVSGNHNFIFGLNTGTQLTSSSNNFFAGLSAGGALKQINNNVFLGHGIAAGSSYLRESNYATLPAVCKMDNNFVAGNQAGFYIGQRSKNNRYQCYDGCGNPYFGYTQYCRASKNNILIGYKAGFGSSARACNNTFLGFCAGGNSPATGINSCNNTFIGYKAGASIGYSSSTSNNTFIGFCAGFYNTYGASNTFIGFCAGAKNTNSNNTFIGCYAGTLNTSGRNNIFVGQLTGWRNTTGSDNIFLGYRPGSANTTGSNNIIMGMQAGLRNCTGSNNIFLGRGAGQENTTGNYNNFIGRYTGVSNTTGCNNNFFGNSAGQRNTTACNNNFFGYRAGRYNCAGQNNNFLGRCTGVCNRDTGNDNNFLGDSAGCYNSGRDNNFMGYLTGRRNGGNNNNFFGRGAGLSNISGSSNNFLGRYVGGCNTTGSDNNFLGRYTGGCNTTGCNNNFLGCKAGYCNTTGASNNFLGRCAGAANTNGGGNNFLGADAGLSNITGGGNNFLGTQAGRTNTTGSNNNFLGECAGYCNTTGRNNNFFGSKAGRANTTGCNNNFLGMYTGRYHTSGSFNNFLGYCAGSRSTTGNNNTFIGRNAGCINTVGANNIIIGNGANVNTNALSGVTVLGTGAIATQTNQIVLSSADISLRTVRGTAAGPNVFIGDNTTGNNDATGNHNFAFGLSAGNALTSGSNNVFVGNCTGRVNTTGASNNFLGFTAGCANTTGTNNNFFGDAAGRANTTGFNNNFLGQAAGCTNTIGSNNTIIGDNANVATNSLSGVIALGARAIATQSNQLVIGSATSPLSGFLNGNLSVTSFLSAANISLANATLITPASVVESDKYLIININGTNLALNLFNYTL